MCRQLLAAVSVIAIAGVLYLGAFPPEPQVRQVQKVLPNDHFQRAP